MREKQTERLIFALLALSLILVLAGTGCGKSKAQIKAEAKAKAQAAEAQALAERYAHIYFTAGIHPHEAQHASAEEIAKIRSRKCLAHAAGSQWFWGQKPRAPVRFWGGFWLLLRI